ncbi:unnamed protein product [Closterium sp. NIES-65]|nr:unnamed protein product [Closterium sp. NIES-65]
MNADFTVVHSHSSAGISFPKRYLLPHHSHLTILLAFSAMALRQAARRGATIAYRSHHVPSLPLINNPRNFASVSNLPSSSAFSTFPTVATSSPLSRPSLPTLSPPAVTVVSAAPSRGVFAASRLTASVRSFASAAGSTETKVITIASPSEFTSLINDPSRLVVVDFTAQWCGPCRSIAPLLDEISRTHESVAIAKVDIDDAELAGVVGTARISSVPTFHFYKAGKLLSQFSGADALKLKDTIALLQK